MFIYKYPRPSVATDSVVFGFDGRELFVLLIERGVEPFKGSWALPGGFLKPDETVEDCARRELEEETGARPEYLEQFHVFSKPSRDPRTRVLSVAFYALVRKSEFRLIAGDDAAKACWYSLDALPPLAFDHASIIESARRKLREVIHTRPIAFKLLDKKFSMPELQRVYELITGQSYDRRNFARKMSSSGVLACEEAAPGSGRQKTAYSLAKEVFDDDSFWNL